MNKYMGMDLKTLQQHAEKAKSVISLNKWGYENTQKEIEVLKAKLLKYKRNIEGAEKGLELIEQAKGSADAVKYEYVVILRREEKEKYVGPQNRYLTYASDYKQYVALTFALAKVNVLGIPYGYSIEKWSKEYITEKKGTFNTDVLEVCKEYNISKIYSPTDLKVNSTLFKKFGITIVPLTEEETCMIK